MSPRDEWTDRRLDDLATKVDLMATAVNHVARHAVKIDTLEDDIREGKGTRREDVARFEAALTQIAKTCEDNTRRVEAKIDGQRWSPTLKVAAGAAVLGPVATIAAVLLQGSPS